MVGWWDGVPSSNYTLIYNWRHRERLVGGTVSPSVPGLLIFIQQDGSTFSKQYSQVRIIFSSKGVYKWGIQVGGDTDKREVKERTKIRKGWTVHAGYELKYSLCV